jgi:Pyruvate/2-oxoacid:ferredoxin oxidoreductase delta subunit
VLAVDAIVTAIGQDPDLDLLPHALARAGSLIEVDQRQATCVQGVYAGGDVASMARFVTEAIGMGKRAAIEIERAFRARTPSACATVHEGAAVPAEAVVGISTINTFYYEPQARADVKPLEPAERLKGSVEVQPGFDLDQALAESTRCFSCGTCIDCDNCVIYCPDLAIRREPGGYVVLADYCKGCGLCVKECPTGSMKMVEERR